MSLPQLLPSYLYPIPTHKSLLPIFPIFPSQFLAYFLLLLTVPSYLLPASRSCFQLLLLLLTISTCLLTFLTLLLFPASFILSPIPTLPNSSPTHPQRGGGCGAITVDDEEGREGGRQAAVGRPHPASVRLTVRPTLFALTVICRLQGACDSVCELEATDPSSLFPIIKPIAEGVLSVTLCGGFSSLRFFYVTRVHLYPRRD